MPAKLKAGASRYYKARGGPVNTQKKKKQQPAASKSPKDANENKQTNTFWQNILKYPKADDFWKETVEDKIQYKLTDKEKELLNKISLLDISDPGDST